MSEQKTLCPNCEELLKYCNQCWSQGKRKMGKTKLKEANRKIEILEKYIYEAGSVNTSVSKCECCIYGGDDCLDCRWEFDYQTFKVGAE